MYDKKVPVKLTKKLPKTIIIPTLVYCSERCALHRADQHSMHTTQGKSRKDRMKWPSQSPHMSPINAIHGMVM